MRLVVDVGGTKTLIVAIDRGGHELQRARFSTDQDYSDFEANLIKHMEKLTDSTSQPLEGIAVGMPGLVDYGSGIVVAFGNRDWKDINIRLKLKQHFSVPVVVDNDANLGAVGEARRGAGKGHSVVLYIAIGTGVGTGITVSGKTDPALAKSEGGNIFFKDRGKYIQWEKMVSGKIFFEKHGTSGKHIPASNTKVWKPYGKQVGLGIKELLAIIQPDIVVIGGGMGQHLDKYKKYMLEAVKSIKTPVVKLPEIVSAKHPENAVILGGIEVINDELS